MSERSRADRPGWILRDMERLATETKKWPEWKRRQLEEQLAPIGRSDRKPQPKTLKR